MNIFHSKNVLVWAHLRPNLKLRLRFTKTEHTDQVGYALHFYKCSMGVSFKRRGH